MTNVLILIFAVTLCLVNAVVWTFVSGLPLVGIAWCAAAALCMWLRKWSRGF